MIDPRGEHIERVLFILGFIAVAVVFSFAYFIHQNFALERLEKHFRSEFILFQHYGGDSLPLPPLRVRRLDNGKEANIQDFHGSYVLLNLWATWCTPCLAELPAMQRLKTRYSNDNFEIIAVSVESDRTPEALMQFLDRNRIGNVAYYQDAWNNLQKALIFNALPTTYLIGPDGRILYQMTGTTEWDGPEMIKFLDAARKVY